MTLSLLTGFPGFIGRRLVRHLLDGDSDAAVVALVEPRMLDAGRQAAAEIDSGRIEVLAGDITERRLGLEDADYERLTGETQKFDGPYYMLRAISQVNRLGRPVMQFGRLQANFNVVPVDYVVAAIAAAAAEPDAVDQTLHLVDPDPVTSGELVNLLSQH